VPISRIEAEGKGRRGNCKEYFGNARLKVPIIVVIYWRRRFRRSIRYWGCDDKCLMWKYRGTRLFPPDLVLPFFGELGVLRKLRQKP